MILFFSLLEGVVERGLLFSLVVAAVYLSSRIVRFDDLSIEGSFGIGGAVTAVCLTNSMNVFFIFVGALIAGGLTGMLTGLLYAKLKLNNLISGIIVSTGMFSIALKVASANVYLGETKTIFTRVSYPLLLLLCVSVVIISALMWLLRTEVGFLFRALGENKRMLTLLGKSIDAYIILSLIIANAITALAGSLFVQLVGYFSIWSNVGMLITALTGLILAEMLCSRIGVASIILGAIAYQAIVTATIELQCDQSWNKLITAVLLVFLLSIKKYYKR